MAVFTARIDDGFFYAEITDDGRTRSLVPDSITFADSLRSGSALSLTTDRLIYSERMAVVGRTILVADKWFTIDGMVTYLDDTIRVPTPPPPPPVVYPTVPQPPAPPPPPVNPPGYTAPPVGGEGNPIVPGGTLVLPGVAEPLKAIGGGGIKYLLPDYGKTIMWPADQPNIRLELPHPKFGDTHTDRYLRINRRTRGDDIIIADPGQWRDESLYRMEWDSLNEEQWTKAREFFRRFVGVPVVYYDHYGVGRLMIPLRPDAEFAHPTVGYYTFSMDWEIVPG